MDEQPENHTPRLLRELRTEMREMRDDLTNRIDGNTIVLNMLAGMLQITKGRITRLETGFPLTGG